MLLVNERIDRGLAHKGRTRHRQIRPWRNEPRAYGKLLLPVAQPADQSKSESGPGAVATDRNMRSSDTLFSQELPCSQRVIVRCGKRMLRRESIADGKCPDSRRPARFGHQTTMALD